MSKTLSAALAVAALAVPAIAIADDQPSDQNKQNAQQYCRDLRDASGKDNFRSMFGGGSNAFGKCVSQNAKKDQQQEETAHVNAAKQCKAERDQLGKDAFQDKYATNAKKDNGYGKCVSQHAKANKAEEDQTDDNDVKAAKKCKAEKQESGADAFGEKYGTNENKKNAFGKCVSKKSNKLDSQEDTDGSDGVDNPDVDGDTSA